LLLASKYAFGCLKPNECWFPSSCISGASFGKKNKEEGGGGWNPQNSWSFIVIILLIIGSGTVYCNNSSVFAFHCRKTKSEKKELKKIKHNQNTENS
jgi:hypothetical protein